MNNWLGWQSATTIVFDEEGHKRYYKDDGKKFEINVSIKKCLGLKI
jgi:hypothetical protein